MLVEKKTPRIAKLCDFAPYIKSSNDNFFAKVKDCGGYNNWFRALLAQILWLTFLYQISILLIPIKEFLARNILLVGILIGFNLVWRGIKDNMPDWFDDIIKGGIYYKCDLEMLNIMLFTLFSLNVGALVCSSQKRPEIQK